MDNPFNLIVPRDDELMINEKSLKAISDKIKDRITSRKLVILEGDYGSGKSLYLKRLHGRLKTKKETINFTDVIITVLEGKVPVKNKSVFIENLDLLHGFKKDQVYRFSKALIKLLDKGMIVLAACRKDTLSMLYEANPLIRSKTNRIKIPHLSFDQAKKLVVNRLNESRSNYEDDIEPFSNHELRTIWHKTNGNPRLLLLLLGPLYDQRMMMSE